MLHTHTHMYIRTYFYIHKRRSAVEIRSSTTEKRVKSSRRTRKSTLSGRVIVTRIYFNLHRSILHLYLDNGLPHAYQIGSRAISDNSVGAKLSICIRVCIHTADRYIFVISTFNHMR